jgi:hypothetical protein
VPRASRGRRTPGERFVLERLKHGRDVPLVAAHEIGDPDPFRERRSVVGGPARRERVVADRLDGWR